MRVDLSQEFSNQFDIVNLFEEGITKGVEPGQLVGESPPEIREALLALGLNQGRLATSGKENAPENL